VKKGETLSSIAKKYGTTVSKIKRLNNLRSTKIRIGQRLKVKRR
jgi:LysM repeat protein